MPKARVLTDCFLAPEPHPGLGQPVEKQIKEVHGRVYLPEETVDLAAGTAGVVTQDELDAWPIERELPPLVWLNAAEAAAVDTAQRRGRRVA